MPLSLDDYVKHLQELQAKGHGHLPVCYCDEDGWQTVTPCALPCLMKGDYSDETSTRWSWKNGEFIAL